MRIGCVVDPDSSEALAAYTDLAKRYGIINLDNASDLNFDVIITLGGDGVMLKTLHRIVNTTVPVFGMNYGSIGFLLNRYSADGLIDRIQNAIASQLNPLEVKARTIFGTMHSMLAINEMSLMRQTQQSAKIKISVDNDVRLQQLTCDGILVATPAGSSAYNYAVGGLIIPIDANVMAMSPISPFRPPQWRGALLLRKSVIQLEVLDYDKRPVSVSADSAEIQDIKSVELFERSDIKLSLLFDQDDRLEKRAMKEQFI